MLGLGSEPTTGLPRRGEGSRDPQVRRDPGASGPDSGGETRAQPPGLACREP